MLSQPVRSLCALSELQIDATFQRLVRCHSVSVAQFSALDDYVAEPATH